MAELAGEAPRDDARQVLAAIVESSDLAILSKTLEGIITSWNPAAERLYGYTAQEAIGRPIALIVPPDRSDELARIMAQLARGERVGQLETVRVHKDGHRIAISLIVSPIRDAEGRIVGGASIARDLTELKQAEAALQASEQRAAAILESIGDAFYTLDRDWRLTYLNARAEQLWGVKRQSVLGRSLWEVFPQAVGTHTCQEHLRAALERRPPEYETLSPILGGWIEVNVYPNPTGMTVYFRDISARKRAEEAVRAHAAQRGGHHTSAPWAQTAARRGADGLPGIVGCFGHAARSRTVVESAPIRLMASKPKQDFPAAMARTSCVVAS